MSQQRDIMAEIQKKRALKATKAASSKPSEGLVRANMLGSIKKGSSTLKHRSETVVSNAATSDEGKDAYQKQANQKQWNALVVEAYHLYDMDDEDDDEEMEADMAEDLAERLGVPSAGLSAAGEGFVELVKSQARPVGITLVNWDIWLHNHLLEASIPTTRHIFEMRARLTKLREEHEAEGGDM